jgi:hypothetical protein
MLNIRNSFLNGLHLCFVQHSRLIKSLYTLQFTTYVISERELDFVYRINVSTSAEYAFQFAFDDNRVLNRVGFRDRTTKPDMCAC